MFCGPFVAVCAIAASAFVAGVTSGSLREAFRAAAVTIITMAAFQAAGDITGFFPGAHPVLGGHGPLQPGSPAHIFNIASHAGIGCVTSVASG
jgi:hypothetical protein